MYLTANTYIPVPDRMLDTVLREILKSNIIYQLSKMKNIFLTNGKSIICRGDVMTLR